MANIIVKKYEGYNRAMGKYITSREHYEKEMVKGGYVPFEKAAAIAEKTKQEQRKEYNGLSKQAMEVCKAARDQADKKGNLKPSSRLIDGMKQAGVCFDLSKLPKEPKNKGGFDASD